jgi:TonB family protein
MLFPISGPKRLEMKQCPICNEEFADKFSFCPVDGTPLNGHAARVVAPVPDEPSATVPSISINTAEQYFDNGFAASVEADAGDGAPALPIDNEYHLTIMEDESLISRLMGEVKEVAHQSQLTWPEFKRDPFGFTSRTFRAYGQAAWRALSTPNVAIAIIASILVMFSLAGGIALIERFPSGMMVRAGVISVFALFLVLLIALAASLPSNYRSLSRNESADTQRMAFALLAAFAFMVTLVGVFYGVDRYRRERAEALAKQEQEQMVVESMVDIPEEEKLKEGPAGRNKGSGGGSKPQQEKPGGGGGGGDKDETRPTSQGKLPMSTLQEQIIAARPEPPPTKQALLPVMPTVRVDPMLMPVDPRNIPIGLPESKSTEMSAGQGDGRGYGGGEGTGIKGGSGAGLGPGSGYNTGGGPPNEGGGGRGGGGEGGGDPNRVYNPKDVSQKARILSKPEPQYTEEARKNQVSGTVVLRAVFSSSGQVTNIRAVNGLPYGLTEKAIGAARQIRFTPATKDGRAVSQYIQIEYNFNLY